MVWTPKNLPIVGVEVVLHVPTGTPNTGTVVQNQWRALPSAASQYGLGFASTSPRWSIDTSSGVLTYNGPQRQFAVYGSVSIYNSSAGLFGFCFSHSAAALIGTTNNSNFEARMAQMAGSESGINLAFFGAVNIADGNTIQGCVRNLADTVSFNISRYQLLLLPTGG